MNKYFIKINETKEGMYEFLIEFINENMEEREVLGAKNNIEDLFECYEMIKDFPILSQLEQIQLNRYNNKLRLNVFELTFNEAIIKTLKSNNKPIEIYEFN
jgi:signal-transduction protein with cAMP-binding, CBS, and nucleotidyltransferase domain